MSSVVLSLLLAAGQLATGIGSGPTGPGLNAMPVSTGGDAPGVSVGVSRNPAALRKVTPASAAAFRARTAGRRAEAEAAVAAGQQSAAAEQLRSALQKDMEIWRDSFGVNKAEWKSYADQWLPETSSLTSAQWAERRLSWFQTRDTWLASKQKKS